MSYQTGRGPRAVVLSYAVTDDAVVFVLPVVVFTFIVRNHLLRGVTFGAVRR